MVEISGAVGAMMGLIQEMSNNEFYQKITSTYLMRKKICGRPIKMSRSSSNIINPAADNYEMERSRLINYIRDSNNKGKELYQVIERCCLKTECRLTFLSGIFYDDHLQSHPQEINWLRPLMKNIRLLKQAYKIWETPN
jgi:hypothetical protein